MSDMESSPTPQEDLSVNAEGENTADAFEEQNETSPPTPPPPLQDDTTQTAEGHTEPSSLTNTQQIGETELSPPHLENGETTAAEELNVDSRLQETIEDRRNQALTKGVLALARMRLQARMRNESSNPAEPDQTQDPPINETLASKSPRNETSGTDAHLNQGSTNEDPQNWGAESDNEPAEEESTEFENIEKWYRSLRNPSIEDMIKWQTAKFKEETRKKRLQSRKKLSEEQKEPADNQLFCSEDEEGARASREPEDNQPFDPNDDRYAPASRSQDGPSNKRRKTNRTRKSNTGGIMRGRPPAKNGRRSKANDVDFESLFQTDIIADAHANSSIPVHNFTKKNKDQALAELIASIPIADRKEAIPDKRLVRDATKKFTRTARSDGKGGWKIKGMKTSLYSYQILGAAFMRDRENGPARPHGGFLCDVMGFGKTIQTLANMVDGVPVDKNERERTTLIVVPAHLVSHWASQIQRHCEEGVLGPVIRHHARSRMVSQDAVNDLQMFGVIITTYDEIRRSYPDLKPPDELISEAQIREWRKETYKKHAGPLHRIKFRRIVLDEGHYIKNPESKVSVAVRALTGRYKWILSGTPVHNGNEEFFPYLDFLKAPQIGRYEAFLNNYCNGDDSSNLRLVNILRPIMFRRTHSARLFAMPILKLPDIGQRTVEIGLCEAEKQVYTFMIKTFIERINELSAPEKVECQCRCILTMILKLRMFTSHLLTVQDVLKSTLSGKAMKELNRLIKDETNPDDPSVKIVHVLNALTSGATPAEPQKTTEPKGLWGDQSTETRDKLVTQFRKIMIDLHDSEAWDERLARTTCPSCGSVPIDACVTSCMHLYCEECLLLLGQGAQERGNTQKICASCGEEILETARCGSVEDLHIDSTPPPSQPGPRSKKSRPQKKQGQKRKRAPENNRNSDDEDDLDWIAIAADAMPSAKLTEMRNIVAEWITVDPETKIVIFTQFYSVVHLISTICEGAQWGYTTLTGKMSIASREKSMADFRESEDLRVMIASLKAGGIGLDLTMANKCILIDPWWNEAVQQQAYCRLFRIGQERNVEVVKLVVKETIDEYMIDLQNRKTVEIDKTIGEAALSERATLAELLRMFGEVKEGENGAGFTVIRDDDEQQEWA